MSALGALGVPLGVSRALADIAGSPAATGAPLLPFDLHAVRLGPGPVRNALEVNRRYLMGLDPERLLHMFRVTAGLPSAAAPLGGWEAPDNELRGHFTGHYLSACALLAAHTGDAAVRERGARIATELAKCQAAIGNGYLSAFPEELFDRLRAGRPAWAPFYTLHKIMAGLLDTYTLSGEHGALETLLGMAHWTERWVQPLNDDHMARVLEREYGGMNEVLYSLAAVSADTRWRELAHRFDHERIFAPLAAGRDELQGLHANTTIPQVIGAARGYEVSGATELRAAAEYFWHTVTERRCYCTGGSSNGESWNTPPNTLAHELSGYTEESCVTYNLQKLTRHVYQWTADPRAFDYYERAFYNGILGVQHPADGDKLYYLPLQSGYWKLFGTPLQDFWCCTGSMAEAFAKLGDSIYFHDAAGVYVNLFVTSELDWGERGVRLNLQTRFPEEETVRLTLRSATPVRLAVRVRVPSWCQGGSAQLNGRALEGFAEPGGYFSLERRWRDGDELTVRLPLRLHAAPMPDDPTLQAVMYGPLVLAGRLGSAGLNGGNLRAPPTKPRTVPEYPAEPLPAPAITARVADPASWLTAVPGRPLEFHTKAAGEPLTLVPLNRIFDERYAVYWKFAPPAPA
ncbi:MAG TPA: beta-L-arabinofuranosidase domain-containing protein [Candidatus Dormibacteraeota bacterium]|nr:beta-L-arabinofuranosidase domain-containing protein [Candidatus Dormibacteraeota bacterium]